jgi:hypothetical protein
MFVQHTVTRRRLQIGGARDVALLNLNWKVAFVATERHEWYLAAVNIFIERKTYTFNFPKPCDLLARIILCLTENSYRRAAEEIEGNSILGLGFSVGAKTEERRGAK